MILKFIDFATVPIKYDSLIVSFLHKTFHVYNETNFLILAFYLLNAWLLVP